LSSPDTGITVVLDRLSGLVKEEFHEVAKFVNLVMIGWGLSLVWGETGLRSRIQYYHDEGVKVALSGTLIERSFQGGGAAKTLQMAKDLSFDFVEISDGIIDMTAEVKASLVAAAKQMGFAVLYTVGKKDPSAQPSQGEMLVQIREGLKLEPYKVLIESRERGRGVGIYDEEGNVRWPQLRSITGTYDHEDLIFEAPSEAQQAALILELGPRVNLGHVALGSVATLQSERMGLRFDTFGIIRPKEELRAGPSVKFVLFAIRNHQPIDQKGIAATTQLPRRTIQKALDDLLKSGLITEHPSFEDRRSKVYRATGSAQPSR
jgi:phosphosulfolactate synthase